MSINKVPTIKGYWECGKFIGNEGIRNVWLDLDLKTFYEVSIFWAIQKVTELTKVTKSDPSSTILIRVLVMFQMMILKALTSIWEKSNVDQV